MTIKVCGICGAEIEEKNDDEKNLISVCVSCHKKLHKGIKYGK